MGFENKYPYTDFHELNLDWILEVVKRIETEWPEFKTTLETEWNDYKDELTGESGEWPTFKTQIETTINNFIHDVVGQYNGNVNYQVGMFCYYEGNVYKCTQISTAAYPRPFSSYGWFSYAGQNTNSIVNDLFNYLTNALNGQNTTINYWIQHTAAEWNETTAYKAGDYCSAYVGGAFNPFSWRYYKCLQDCTNVSVFDTNYWKEVVFASDVAETIAAYKQAMQDQYDEFLEDYQRQFGVVQTTGSSTTDVMSQNATTEAIGNSVGELENKLINGAISVSHADSASSLDSDVGVDDQTPFSYQTSGGESDLTTGVQKFLKLVGCDIVNNQPIINPDFAYGTTLWRANGRGTLSVSDGIASYTITALTGSDVESHRIEQDVAVKAGHQYLLRMRIKSPKSCKVNISSYASGVLASAKDISANVWSYYYRFANVTTSENNAFYFSFDGYDTSHGFEVGDVVKYQYCGGCDLTQMFGSNDIVNAIIGTGTDAEKYINLVTFLGGQLPTDHDTGTIVPSKSKYLFNTGYNQWDEEWELGTYNTSTGEKVSGTSNIRSKNMYKCFPNTVYYLNNIAQTGGFRFFEYDENGYFIKSTSQGNGSITTTPNTRYFTFFMASGYGTTYNHDICIFLYWDGSKITYEPWNPKTYELPNRTMHGIPRVDANGKIYAEGDELLPNGTGTQNYEEYTILGTETVSASSFVDPECYIIIQIPAIKNSSEYGNTVTLPNNIAKTLNVYAGQSSGSHNLAIIFNTGTYSSLQECLTAITGKKVIIPLDTPVAITGEQSFTATPHVDDFGTMMFQDENGVQIAGLQGNEIFYKANVSGFAESLYVKTDGDPDAIVLKTDIDDTALQSRGYLKLTALSGYDATKTQTLKNVQGVFTWIDD